MRRNAKKIAVGNAFIGGGSPILVQSMLNTPSGNINACVSQALELESAGCELIRIAIPNKECVKNIPALKEAVKAPIAADIHFDYRLAIESAAAGADKIRINPGNIGGGDRVKKVVAACREKNIPIRVGVNSGSVEKEILAKYGSPVPEALAESAMGHVKLLEKFDFDDIVVSIKSSDVQNTVKAYELMAERCDYPLHIGVTEAGTRRMGVIKSAVGIGALLLKGIGDTVRVSLTAPPVEEIYAAYGILDAAGARGRGARLISCPTCGRTKINLLEIAENIENILSNINKNITIAVMGCAVNGPGEAREADIGIAGGDGEGVIFKKGVIVKKAKESELLGELIKEIEKM
ncbi:MAG: flavodoxin-dependent (E)-4-hydroxy-3-methylbut-2-enyl-diphosphate synthase [Oscillospiraceae bacterium]|nr:flavodoxin-dependent (E)-4-hydroxy-3-methylbut-2-enyl-diphosphate synthase [Oscillospiraceae bacterium]